MSTRIAGAPISWGVSEVPGWGHQMRRERVLTEMRELGLAATEAGPDGFLPDDPGELRELLAAYDYVFEQDAKLAAEPQAGNGPREDVARSLAFLQGGLPGSSPSARPTNAPTSGCAPRGRGAR